MNTDKQVQAALDRIEKTYGYGRTTPAFHTATRGRVILYYSPTQKAELKKATPGSKDTADLSGSAWAMNAQTGEVYEYTDLEVLEGDVSAIQLRHQPGVIGRAFNIYSVSGLISCKDAEVVTVIDPCNLVTMKDSHGRTFTQVYKDANPEQASIVSCYGEKRAKEIKNMIGMVRPEYRCRLVENFDGPKPPGRDPGFF